MRATNSHRACLKQQTQQLPSYNVINNASTPQNGGVQPPRLCRLCFKADLLMPSLRAVSPTIGRAEAHPSPTSVSCCALALRFRGGPRQQLSALRFMLDAKPALVARLRTQ